ncbi:shikimate dehydrogenase [bacterium (Candidatus Blackallbacteria) CG17_big_fil_post_rev_8_21_14_2_50_48_46]|uniref:Shikimate dehydrogenase (NADP(+)) n=1 Tax=bacterium (Candidatus Blackallbacteria) CG17_big_fil_post_rev_8_21_14_2_50_48_46 TaxID=2014261 RepID=A0A2M7FYJ7_9BACT|nr:MAG: shikimate dehydrogenase [bacterium (Candidatus Blackallbacteria) CG18_big_fil_WC_8_21_14_2_50_49_26]PIW14422.1 MAG: shikimate dehydrogenase [bacterium (Candidatus Blackallbacteria) CG17_big_fil_post_rev_8_21_14_2_50_48_46]PIW46928.1 MAG: shikimate dehydrogenase [bacterium (Candidatus Blackallbacteria) CG13_big_fil_rev_8_21_14_2_50_49_14]
MPKVDQHTQVVGLMGYPLSHSFSPAMHNAAFEALKLNYVYIPMPVPPGRLSEAVQGLRALNFVGANVTIPHKEEIIPFLDYVTEEAQLAGAVNTLFWTEDSYLVGDNTDVEGFRRTLQEWKIDLQGRTGAIIGSGGAARAVAIALARSGVKEIIFWARRYEAVQRVIEDLQPLFPDLVWSSHTKSTPVWADDLTRTSLLVNASPVGMFPHVQDSPLSRSMLGMLPEQAHVYDLVYNPQETLLLKTARELGSLQTHSGVDMLVFQGAVAFERWTGQVPPVALMRNIILERLSLASD